MTDFSWKTCLWPEDEHPRPLCRHLWERELRAQHEGEMPINGAMSDKQWQLILSLTGEPHCPCSEELQDLQRKHGPNQDDSD